MQDEQGHRQPAGKIVSLVDLVEAAKERFDPAPAGGEYEIHSKVDDTPEAKRGAKLVKRVAFVAAAGNGAPGRLIDFYSLIPVHTAETQKSCIVQGWTRQ